MTIHINNSVFVIAEAGVNHNGSIELAENLVRAAAASGADAVKFQTFRARNVVTKHAEKAEYQKLLTQEESQLQMLEALELPFGEHKELIKLCNKLDIQFLSTAFDSESLSFLSGVLNLPVLKIPSGELTNGPLLLEYAKTGCNLIVSTGMADLEEIREALGLLAFGMTQGVVPSRRNFMEAYQSVPGREKLHERVTLLQCTTDYPTRPEDVNLRAMETMRKEFSLPVGLSDHTEGITAALSAVALGSVVIEKHLTLDRLLPGPDHRASIEPTEFTEMVEGIRQVTKMLGDGLKKPSAREKANRPIVRKSLVAATNIKDGDILARDNLAIKRPGTGRSPMDYWDIIGSTSTTSYSEDDLI